MADSSVKPWSDNPNAPNIPHPLYIDERAKFAGDILAGILYGMPTRIFIYLHLPRLLDRLFQVSLLSCSSGV